MKLSVHEFAALTGVSVRTLHYYDEIGLLIPAQVDESSGYRYYDEASLSRMQQILFYRELDFPLKSILEILASPAYDMKTALSEQKNLLILKKQRLERLISAIDGAMKGENIMSAFDNSEFEKYSTEARERWGKTDAYKEYSEKSKGRTAAKQQGLIDDMNAIFAEFAACKNSGAAPDSASAQQLVKKLQAHITENYYACTDAILAGLGQMYVCDERFRTNIDKNGSGTSEFAASAIEYYCRAK